MIPKSRDLKKRKFKELGVQICQELLAYLRDHSRIQSLSIGMFYYKGKPIKVVDAFHDPPRPRRTTPYWKRYNQRQDSISFVEWINELDIT